MINLLRRFTMPAFAAAAVLASQAAPVNPVAPTVPAGSFNCFRGMPESEINRVEAPQMKTIHRAGPKLGNPKFDNTDGHDLREVPTEGEMKILVILVNYDDTKMVQGRPDPRALFDDMLNGDNFTYQNATGSASKFYQTISAGQFKPQFDVYGPVELSKISREYVTPTNPEKFTDANGTEYEKYPASQMIEEAVRALDDQIDYSQYDSNNDGMVDFVYVFYAGKGATTGGNRNTTVWPHAFTLEAGIGAPVYLDGVGINRYACSAELGSTNKLSGIGTFCHEFGHILGLPDIYDTANNGSVNANFTAGTFTCMDSGNYNNDEHTPPFFSTYEQYALEWMKPTTLTGGGNFTLLPLSARKFGYKVDTQVPTEYFLLEARDNQSYDKYLECYGLAVWHIDFNLDIWNRNVVNNVDSHQRIDLIEADNDRVASSRNGDLFPGITGICEFTDNRSPSFLDWNNRSTGYQITEIRRNFDGTVSFVCTNSNGLVMSDAQLAAPMLSITKTGADYIECAFEAIDGANGYYYSVFPMDSFDGVLVETYVDGYHFRPVEAADGVVTFKVEGLETGKRYGVIAYAVNDVNASRMAEPVVVATVSENFDEAKTNMYAELTDADNQVMLYWDAVAGATDYDLTVARRSAESTGNAVESVGVNFDNSRMPEGWMLKGEYDSRAKYSGEATPSVQLAYDGAYLQTATYEHQIKEISFWVRKRFEEELCRLQVYGVNKEGVLTPVATLTDIAKDGGRVSVEMPAGCYGVRLAWRFESTGLDCNIDDVNIEFAETFTDVPVANLDVVAMESPCAVLVKGLEANVEYVAYVTPKRGEQAGVRSSEILFTPSGLPVSGVEEIVSSPVAASFTVVDGVVNAPADVVYSVYTIDGRCVASGVSGSYELPQRGLYIVTAPGVSTKLCW